MRPRAIVWRLLAAALASAACAPSWFNCGDDHVCGESGRCEASGYCSFADSACQSGRRYGELANERFSGQCVAAELEAASSDDVAVPGDSGDAAPIDPEAMASSSTGGHDPEAETGEGTAVVPGATQWWDPRWPLRVSVDFSGDWNASGPLVVPAWLDAPELAADGAQVRVVGQRRDDAYTLLPYELESGVDGGALVWIDLDPLRPAFEGAAPQHTGLWIYYGRRAPGAPQADGQPFDAYDGVWHLSRDRVDSSGHDLDPELTGVQPAPGKLAAAARFGPGASAVVEAPSSLDDLFASGATVSLWFRADGWGEGGFGRLVDRSSGSGMQGEGWSLLLAEEDGELWFVHFQGATNRVTYAVEDFSFVDGAWHHLCLEYDPSQGPPRLAIDGIEAGTYNRGNYPVAMLSPAHGLPLTFGQRANANDRAFDGALDEVRIARAPWGFGHCLEQFTVAGDVEVGAAESY